MDTRTVFEQLRDALLAEGVEQAEAEDLARSLVKAAARMAARRARDRRGR